jgi:serine/threonine protein phosphatase PrpC
MQKISFSGSTDMGKLRTNNEDAFVVQHIWDENHILGVAIDGVGGYEGGEVAAEIAKNTIVEHLEKYPNGERAVLLQQAVTEANNKIVEERQRQPKLSQMSCVLSACLVEVDKRQINMAHIGDSRFYQFQNGVLAKLSHDHSYVGYREDIGDLSEEAAMNHPKRNEINRLLGDRHHNPDDRDFLEIKTFPLLPNSILLLCSDGLTDLVTKAEISNILNQNILLEKKVQALIDLANEKGGKDNITVVLIDYQNDEVSNIENVIIENSGSNIENNKDDKNSKEEKFKGRKIKLRFAVLIAVAALLLGTAGGWFGKSYSPNREINNIEQADSVSINKIDSLKTEVLPLDSLNLTDTVAVKQYIQNLNDIVRAREQKIEKLKNIIQTLTRTE